MTEAANVLYVTQSTLSRQIADLERELGVTLFDRTNRSCALTGDGMHLRQRAEEIPSFVDQTEAELADSEGSLAGTVRIGAGRRGPCALCWGRSRSCAATTPVCRWNSIRATPMRWA